MPHVSGSPVKMNRPLDFMAVSDHAEYMGALMEMQEEDSPLYNISLAQKLRSENVKEARKANRNLRMHIALNRPSKKLIQKENLHRQFLSFVAQLLGTFQTLL